MIWILIVAVLVGAVPVSVYAAYILSISHAAEIGSKKLEQPVPISVVIPAHNEEDVIEHRIKNLAEMDYPSELIEVIVVDDCSQDDTAKIARESLDEYGLKGKVITNKKRMGTNYSLNKGISTARNEIIVTTDADVVFEQDALKYALNVLLSDEDIGAVCGELESVIDKKSFTTHAEQAYRSVYGKICTWESNVDSTYCFNGPLIALKKEAFSPIPEKKGASDANLALQVRRNGFRCLYVSAAKFYEYIPTTIKEQKRQKLRRSARLLEATASNIDLVGFKYGKFGAIVFPLRFLMFLVVPGMFFVDTALWIYIFAVINPFYGIGLGTSFILAALSGRIRSNLVSSFIWHQALLFAGLFYMLKDTYTWETIERKRILY